MANSKATPCPVPSEAAIDQTRLIAGTALEYYLGEVERFCHALAAGP